MTFPDSFTFSQASFQAFVDCPRLFELRYVLHVAWPEVDENPTLERERHRQGGLAFHRMIAQESAGVPVARLAQTIVDPDVARWWTNYLSAPPPDLPANRYAEITLTAPLLGHRVMAKYDLVAVEPAAQAIVVDWKTYRRRPERARLAARLQTRVYTYLLARAGHELNGGHPPEPAHIEMIYWFAEFAGDPERFVYSAAQRDADGVYLTSLIESIRAHARDGYPKTDSAERCTYCQFGPLCDRGTGIGSGDGTDEALDLLGEADLDLSFDFEQVAEIEY